MARDVTRLAQVRLLLLTSGLVQTVRQLMGYRRGYASQGVFVTNSTPQRCAICARGMVVAVVECYIDS